ncbi:MAG: hypothetical protein ACK4J0_01005, partial [Candidatus Anstonellaceae archaeon]
DFASLVKKTLHISKDEKLRQELLFISLTIKPFLKGNLYGFFDRKTTIKINKNLHVFDLREYKNDKTLKDLVNYLIFDYISHQLLADKTPKALIMDEGWTMVNYPRSEDYVHYIIKDSRKYNVSFVFITQELEDMLSSSAGKSILNNTSTQFIFHHKESAMPLAKQVLNLTDAEYEKLLTVGIGEGLLICDKSRLFFKVKTCQEDHKDLESKKMEKEKLPTKVKAIKEKVILPKILEKPLEEIKKELGIEKSLPFALTHEGLDKKEQEKLIKRLKKKHSSKTTKIK